jgi:hypothetical protein
MRRCTAAEPVDVRRSYSWLVFAWLLIPLSTAQAQWPEDAARPSERGIPRFRVAWTTGERTTEQLAGWDKLNPTLELTGKPLENAERSVRWLRSTRIVSKPSSSPGVHFFGDDFLPGEVVGIAGQAITRLPPSEIILAVKAAVPVDPPGAIRREEVPILAAWVKKIVWQSRGHDDYQPGKAFLRSGRSVSFRGLRWITAGVRLLEDDNVETVPLGDLAELHLPRQEPWSIYLRQLATLSPDCNDRIITVESTGGVRVTTSWPLLRPWLAATEYGAQQVVCVVQPPWALDGLSLQVSDLQRVCFFAPHEVPLAIFEPVQREHRGFAFSGDTMWQRNASAAGSPLFSGGNDYAWGMGVQGQQRLDFLLPAAARRIETWIGIDAKSGAGGAALGHLEMRQPTPEKPSAPFKRSPVLIGSRQPPASLRLDLPPRRTPEIVVSLVTDPLSTSRPAGADPLEIRDYVDWLEPLVIFDRRELAAAVGEQWWAALPGLAAWSVDGDWRPASQWRPGGRPVPGFRREIKLVGGPLRMTRSLMAKGEQTHLVIRASRLAGKSAPIEMRLLIDGDSHARRSVPIDEQLDDPPAMIFDLSPFAGQTINVQLEFRSRGESASLELLGAELECPPRRAEKP